VELCPYSDAIHNRFMFWVMEILVHCLIFTVRKATAVASYTYLSKLCVTHHFNKQLPRITCKLQQFFLYLWTAPLVVVNAETAAVCIVKLWSLMDSNVFMEWSVFVCPTMNFLAADFVFLLVSRLCCVTLFPKFVIINLKGCTVYLTDHADIQVKKTIVQVEWTSCWPNNQ